MVITSVKALSPSLTPSCMSPSLETVKPRRVVNSEVTNKVYKVILMIKSPFVEFCRRCKAFNFGDFLSREYLDLQEAILKHLD